MFGDFLANVKNHSSKVAESFTLDSIKAQTSRLSDNLETLKFHSSRVGHNIATGFRKSVLGSSDSNSDKETLISQKNGTLELKWPVLENNKTKWVTRIPKSPNNEEEEEIVDKFMRVITVNDDPVDIVPATLNKRRNDREEIRRRLAMGSDADDYYGGERPGRKPSLQARLQSGMNLQICFMNETASDTESPNSDSETSCPPLKTDSEKPPAVKQPNSLPLKKTQHLPVPPKTGTRPSTSMLTLPLRKEPAFMPQPMTEADFFACQARLQAEARMALAQAKEMAHMQMEVERQRLKTSPITEMVRTSLEKVGIMFPEDRRRLSRQILTEMNVAQLQVIVNDLHTQIETLNENLVKFLMDRDDLHMEQDSMLVDIEDLTRYLGAKEQTKEKKDFIPLVNKNNNNNNNNNNILSITKPKINRIASLVKK